MAHLRTNIAGVLAVAAVTHVAMIVALPRVVMQVVISRAAARVGVNTPFHAHQPTAPDRGIPLPSPDLLYSGCTLDVTVHPLNVSVTPGSDYLSLAVFDGKSDNVFVTSDRDTHGQPIRLQIRGDDAAAPPAGVPSVYLAGGHGLLLLRGLASTPDMAARTDAARHTLKCEPAR